MGNHGSSTRAGTKRGRKILCTCAQAVALTTAVQLAAAAAARAADLPGELLTASKLIPIDADGRQVCLQINGLTNQLGLPMVIGRALTSVEATSAYTAETQGVYLGDGPSGVPAPPFVQALLDAGAAERIKLTWVDRRSILTLGVPRLLDTGIAASAAPASPAAPSREQVTELHGDAYLVTGPDRELFVHDEGNWIAPVAPHIEQPAPAGNKDGLPGGQAPPSVWNSTRICYALVPDRVLEYGDPDNHGNGVRELSAAILFHPARIPGWISDPRVIEAMPLRMQPDEVRVITFRNDGDGWRPEKYRLRLWVDGKVHLVRQD